MISLDALCEAIQPMLTLSRYCHEQLLSCYGNSNNLATRHQYLLGHAPSVHAWPSAISIYLVKRRSTPDTTLDAFAVHTGLCLCSDMSSCY